ncbi:DUF2690 domain-containing protein [Streptomyces sp. JJ66]|uniref:helix-turn-helix domain-containing protein n=1 Tax=Streptomyces sp. JJ66 TaxID=2803843 RepID=UPI001C574C5C|nr:XRE family transcriptional regulator [Streptomyces sp. JJ66]MBW1602600.1 DUF2690 domain-containing protein [Streptomyces sp. JJ66]
MTEWKPLPAGLEPDVERFVKELRARKDAAGLSLVALAQATAYSKSSWERCLNGGRLPPETAVRALAQRIGGGDAERLLALWELAEHAASGRGRTAPPAAPTPRSPEPGRAAPPPPAAPDPAPASGPGDAPGPGDASGPADAPGPVVAPDRQSPAPGVPPGQPGQTVPDAAEFPPAAPTRRLPVGLLAGAAAAALAVVALAVVLTGRDEPAGPGGGAGLSQAVDDPVNGQVVDCHDSSCDGQDSVQQGCGADAWTAATSRVGQTYVEVRYSSSCRAAWARIRWAQPGDRVEIVTTDGRRYAETVPDDANLAAFTFMVGAPMPGEARACWQTADGEEGCTAPGGSEPLPEAPPVPS